MDTDGELKTMKRILPKNNRGIAMVYVAIALLTMVAFIGLAVDIGYMYVTKGQLQNAADSAALAGAARLKLTKNASLFGNQSSARIAAQTFASKNNAAGSPLTLDLNTGNNANGDIVVGNWDPTRAQTPDDLRFQPADGIMDINAVKVVARRTGESDAGIGTNTRVSIFFGKIFSVLPGAGAGWTSMTAKSQAIAIPNPLGTPALSLCTESCNMSLPADLDIQDNSPPQPGQGVAWTSFSCKNQQVQDSDVTDFIWGRQTVTKLCDSCFTTTNGLGNPFTQQLPNAFSSTTYDRNNKTFNADGTVASWRVAVPVFDVHCSSQDANCNVTALGSATGCPPGTSGSGFETKHVTSIAAITITAINLNPSGSIKKGLRISDIQCVDCTVSSSIPFSFKGSHLVK